MSVQKIYVSYFEKTGKSFLQQVNASRAKEISKTFDKFCDKAKQQLTKEEETQYE